MKNTLPEWILMSLGIILLGFVLYGSWQYYFKKPLQSINYHYTIMPGANATINQPQENPKQKKFNFYAGLWAGTRGEFGGEAGIIW